MVITDLEQEKIASSDKKANRKANTLGSDRSVVEEPFGNANIILPNDIFVKTPHTDSGFAAPDYGDLDSGGGAVATRHILARLHPVEASGVTGPNSIQSFIVVSKTPESDDPVDIEAVRIKHLVPPDLSLGRSHAAETDGYLRGFEMALYPAQSTGGAGTALDAYTGMGAIPITADPGAVDGIGNDGRWVVDYANGVVRLSTPALNGSTGLFNPKNVFGDRDGYEVAVSSEGRLTLFATFYQYTGPSFSPGGVSVNMLTVGDGSDSYGSFYGPTAQVMKDAINSLDGLGGTIFVNSGTYYYEQPVEVPDNVNIVGLSGNVNINGQGGKPIFIFQGSNASIHNLTLFASGSAGAIEFGGTASGSTLDNIIVKNNIIWSDTSSKGVVFAPRNTSITYQNLALLGNHFKSAAASTTYIGQTAYASNSSSINNLRIDGNDFTNTASASNAIDLSDGTVTTSISNLSVSNNHFGALNNVNINNGAVATDVYANNNTQANAFTAYGMLDSEVSQNEYASFTIGLGGLSETRIVGSTLGDVTLDGYIADTTMDSVVVDTFVLDDSCNNVNISNMTCRENASFNGSAVDGNSVSMDNVVVSGSRFLGEFRIAHALSVATSTISEFVLDNNVIDGILRIANAPATAVVSVTFEDMRITNNTIADTNRDSISVGATGTAENVVFDSLLMTGNTLSGDVRFLEDVDFNTTQNSIFAHNTFAGTDAGIYFDTLDVNNVLLESNDLYRVYFLGSESNTFTLSSSDSVSSLVVKDNIFRGDGEINIRFVDTGANNFTLNNTHIVGNSFPETSGSISVLQSADINDDLRIDHLYVLSNNLFGSGSTLVVGGSSVASGTAFFNDSDVSGNNVNGAITVAGVRPNRLTFSNNTSSSGTVSFNRGADSSNISDNVMSAVTFAQTLDDCVFSGNRISSGAALFSSTLNRTIIADNNFESSVSVSGASTGITFTNNYIKTTLGLSTMTDSKFEGNTVVGVLTSGSWSDSIFNDNFLDSDFNGTSLSNSTFASSSVTGNFDLSSGTTSSIVTKNEIQGGTGFVTTSASSSTISENIITAKLDITGTTSICNISGNRSGSMDFGGTISDSVISLNATTTGGASMTSAISDSAFTGNVFQSTNTNAALAAGTLTDCTFSGNVIKSSSGAESPISIGDMTTSVFADNVIDQAATATTTIGNMVDSKITDCVFECTTLDIDSMLDSSFVNVHCKSNLTVTDTATAISDSRITGCHISGTTTVTTTSTSLGAIVDSNIAENIFEGDLTINGAEICVDNSLINENNFHGSFSILITADNGNYALRDSVVSDNVVAVSFIMNNTGGAANNANLVIKSSLTGNLVQGSCTLGANLSTSNATSTFEDSTFSDNRVTVSLTMGPSGRTATLTTYIGSTFSNNVVGVTGGGDFTMRGAMVGCSFDGNSFNNDTDLDTISGGSVSGNVFGADGTGTLDLIGGIINNGVFSDNFVIGNCTVTGALNTALINGNAFGAVLDVNNTVDKCVLSGNRFASSVDFASDFSDSVLSSNQIDSTLTFGTSGNGISRSVIDGNAITGIIAINDTVSGLVVSDNHSSAGIDFASTPNDVKISDNIFTTFTMDSGTAKDNVTVTGNQFTTFEVSGSTITDFIISGNYATSTLTLSSTATGGVVIGNMIEGVTTIGNISSVTMSNNIFETTFTVGDLSSASMNGNTISGVANVGTLTNSTVSLNSFGSTLTFTGAADGSTVSENHVTGAALFTTSSGGFALSETTVDGNIFDSTLTITFSGSSGNDFDAALRESVVSDNRVGTTMLIQSTGATSEFAAYLSTISGNTCGGADTAGTPVVGNITLTSIDTGVATIAETVISNNKCSNMSITHGTGTIDSCDESVISGNTLAVNFSTGRFTDSVMSNNKVTGTVDFTVTTRALISGNVVTGATTLTTTDDSVVNNNKFGGAFIMGAVTDGTINSNYMGSTLTLTSLTRGSITGNTCDGAVNTGNIEDVSISSNAISDAFTAGTVIDSALNGNNIEGAFTSTSLSGGTINGNTIQSTAGFGSVTGSSISGNDITGAVTTSTITSARINNNYFTSTFTTGGTDILDSTMNNNIFTGAFTSSRWEEVACVGNTFVSTIVTTEAGTDKGLDRVTFQGNVCSSAVTFTKSTNGGTDNFIKTSISGNIFNADLSLGTSAIAAEFQDIVITGNSGSGGLDIHTGSNTTSELDDVMIVGNVMRGDFNITRDGGAAANYTVPTTSGVGEGNVMIAFNRFNTYTGVTFNNDRAIGWGTNRTVSGADSEYIGSNAL